MNKKLMISLTAAIVLSLLVAVVVFAGATRDYGTLATEPPAGKVNWTAWLRVTYEDDDGNFIDVHPPQEIMTEDGFNAAGGTGLGYTADGWQIQVENFLDKVAGRRVLMNFCGLEDYAGDNWHKWFSWSTTESSTNHGEVPLRTSTNFEAPQMMPVEFDEDDVYIIRFYGTPNTQYYVYRSQNPAFLGSDRSNGRYMLVDPVTTDGYGYGEYHDAAYNPDFDTWYVVMYFAPTWNGLHGCHSEDTGPTNVRVLDFTANYVTAAGAVELAWTVGPEGETTGYNIWRSTSAGDEGTQINLDPIDRKGADQGYSYTYWDHDLELGVTYYYWLEVLGSSGRLDLVGPETARAINKYYMPVFQK